jgi:hypothetical protein
MATALLSISRLTAPSEPPRGTRIADARQALDHWSRRAAELPWRRRGARRDARRMIATARAQLVGAHLERWGLATVDRAFTPLLDTGGRSAGAHVRVLAFTAVRRTELGRRLLLGAAAVTAGSIAIIAVVAAIATHLIAV